MVVFCDCRWRCSATCLERPWALWATQSSMAVSPIVPSNTLENLWWSVILEIASLIISACFQIYMNPSVLGEELIVAVSFILQCSGPSMEPTIINHDVVFSERFSRHLYKIEKWVSFHAFTFSVPCWNMY